MPCPAFLYSQFMLVFFAKGSKQKAANKMLVKLTVGFNFLQHFTCMFRVNFTIFLACVGSFVAKEVS